MALATYLIILAVILILGYFIKRYTNGPLNPLNKDLTGKLIIITGASDGLGLEIAKNLLKSNASVVFACRNKTKTENIINNLPEKSKKNATFEQIDLESFKSIENFVKQIKSKYPKIDVLINNAGLVYGLHKTEEGFVNVYQINYLAHCLLTLLLLDHFNEKESKVINISSIAYKFSNWTCEDVKYLNNGDLMFNDYNYRWSGDGILYCDTKLLIIYFTKYLASLFEQKYPHIKAVCLHPGIIYTKIFKPKNKLQDLFMYIMFKTVYYIFTKDIFHGVQTQLYLTHCDNKDLASGAYYNTLKVEKYIRRAKDDEIKKVMVNETLNILKSKYKELESFPLCE